MHAMQVGRRCDFIRLRRQVSSGWKGTSMAFDLSSFARMTKIGRYEFWMRSAVHDQLETSAGNEKSPVDKTNRCQPERKPWRFGKSRPGVPCGGHAREQQGGKQIRHTRPRSGLSGRRPG